MSHDSTEPNFIVDETAPISEEEFEHIIEDAIEDIEHPKEADNETAPSDAEDNNKNDNA